MGVNKTMITTTNTTIKMKNMNVVLTNKQIMNSSMSFFTLLMVKSPSNLMEVIQFMSLEMLIHLMFHQMPIIKIVIKYTF